jgi:colanic acid/amylovoran biosynthesis glycosyltransferase
MQIAYLINRYPAVSHTFVRREIAGLERLGHRVDRYSIRPASSDLPDPLDQHERARAIVVLSQGAIALLWATARMALVHPIRSLTALRAAWAMVPNSIGGIIRSFAYLAEGCWLAYRFRHEGVEHLHAHFGTNPAAVARLTHRLCGVPYSFTAHGPDEFDEPRQIDIHGKIAEAKFTVAISHYGRSQLMRWADIADWSKIAVVRCGVDADFLDRPMKGVTATRSNRFCCIARLSSQKGIPLLVEAAAILAQREVSFHLDILGDGELRSQIEQTIVDNGLGDCITLKGFCDSATVRQTLIDARALILSSFAEGLPVVIMEALALGTPVITTAIAGISELVDAHCGWVVPAGTAEALADAMVAALTTDAQTLVEMGTVGRQRVAFFHNADRNAAILADLMQARN